MRRILASMMGVFLTSLNSFAGEVSIRVGHNRIAPAEVSIATGDTVSFHNEDQMPGGHTIVADDDSFESPALGKGETWSREFTETGSHSYHIKEHPSAKGTITVE